MNPTQETSGHNRPEEDAVEPQYSGRTHQIGQENRQPYDTEAPPQSSVRTEPAATQSPAVTDAVRDYLTASNLVHAPLTQAAYRLELGHWMAWCAARQLATLAQAAPAWPEFWQKRCARTATVTWHARAAKHRSFWQWALSTERASASAVKIQFMPARSYKNRQPPDERNYEALMVPDHPATPHSLKIQAILETISATGARAGEICRLQLGDLDLPRREATVALKGSGVGKIYVDDAAAAALALWLTSGRPKMARPESPDNVFLSIRGRATNSSELGAWLARRCRQRGLKNITAHQLRHRLASRLLATGATLP